MPQTDREPTYTFRIDILLLKEFDTWIAQGLHYDITGHGKNVDEALESFFRTAIGQIAIDIRAKEPPLGNIDRAPEFYWERFKAAMQLTEKREKRFSPPEGV